MNLGDGIGINSKKPLSERFEGDFIIINGKHYKLDQISIEFNPDTLFDKHYLKTVSTNKVFP